MRKKNILIASFSFPPLAEVSVIRALKLCKYLPENGWDPTVITVDPRYYGKKIVDELPREFSKINTLRLPFIRIPQFRLLAVLLFPFYVLYQVCKRRKNTEAICMIGSPFHPFILSPVFTKLLKIPTGLDFRDSWSINYGYDGTNRQDVNFFIRGIHYLFYLIEKVGIKYASTVTFATPVLKNEYTEIHPKYSGKYHVILNGYDPEDFINVTPVSLTGGKSIILAGKFYEYAPEAVDIFFEILQNREDVTFIYIGNETTEISNKSVQWGVANKVVTRPYMPYHKVLNYISGSTFCLLTNGVVNGIGTKIFDYLALNKPTLCLVPEGSVISDIFGNTENIVICERPFTYKKVEKKMNSLFNIVPNSSNDLIVDFSRKYSATQFSDIYKKLLR